MKLVSSSPHPMIVDFYPCARFNDKSIIKDKFLKVLTFCGQTQSKKVISSEEMEQEVDERLKLNYTVEGFNEDPQFVSISA